MKLDRLTPRETVIELDRFIVGQDAAKKAVAVALRNRWRRQQLPPELREEVVALEGVRHRLVEARRAGETILEGAHEHPTLVACGR